MRGRVLDLLGYAALRAAEALLLSVPPDVADAVARGVGRLWYRLDATRRRTALDNLRLAFGDALGPEERERLARGSFEHAFVLVVETIRRPRVLRGARDVLRRGRYLGDQARMRAEVDAGRTGLVLAAHLGNWELAGAAVRFEGVRFLGVARPIENPYVDAYVARTRGGADAVIAKQGAARSISRALREGSWVGVIADQNAGRHGVFVPFFGVPASTYPLAATLALRHRVPVYFGAALRRGRDFRYDYVLRRYDAPPSGDERADARALLVAFHAWLEETIRAHPDQYLWLHRRWRTRPPGEPPDARLPSYVRRTPA